jgi:hypothetical protein
MTNGIRRGRGVSVTPRPLFTPGKDLVTIVQEAVWDPESVWTGAENLASTGIRSPDRQDCSQSLYRLSYFGPPKPDVLGVILIFLISYRINLCLKQHAIFARCIAGVSHYCTTERKKALWPMFIYQYYLVHECKRAGVQPSHMQKLFSIKVIFFRFITLDLAIWVYHSVTFGTIYTVSTSAYRHNVNVIMHQVWVQQSLYMPEQALRIPGSWGSQIYRQTKHVGGKFVSSSHRPPLPPRKTFLVLIYVRGWVDPRVIVRPEGLCQWKIPVTPSGINPATLRFLAQHLNQLRRRD